MTAQSQAVIVIPKMGMSPPKEYLQLLFGKYPSYFGSATYISSDGKGELSIGGDKSMPDVDAFMAMLTGEKDDASIFTCMEVKGTLTAESEQPFILLRDPENNQVRVCVFIEGEYISQKNESPHTEEYHASEKVAAEFRRYWKILKGDLNRFEDEVLADNDLGAVLESFCVNRGVIVAFTSNGRVFIVQKGNDDLKGEFSWGWVSNKLGYVEKSETPTTEDKAAKQEAVKGGLLAKIRGGQTSVKPPIIAATTPIDGTTIAKTNGTDTAVTPKAEYISPPKDLTKYDRREGWYENWTTGLKTDGTKLSKKDIKDGVPAEANANWSARKTGKSFKPLSEGLAEMKDAVENSTGKPQAYSPFTPIISPKLLHSLKELFERDEIKKITEDSRVLNPDDLKKATKNAPWSAQTQRDVMDTFRWTPPIWQAYIDECRKENDFTPLILLLEEMKLTIMELMAEEVDTVSTTDTTVATEHPKPPTVETKTAEKPKGGGSLLDRIHGRKVA